MSYRTFEVQLDHGHVVAKPADHLPDQAAALLTILESTPPPVPGLRPFGLARAQFTVPGDFNAPLPEEILRAFEAK